MKKEKPVTAKRTIKDAVREHQQKRTVPPISVGILTPPPPTPQELKPIKHPKKGKKIKALGRLPDGSSFNVTYDAKEQKWRGILVIGLTSPYLSFEGEESGVFTLLAKLDRMYREKMEMIDATYPMPREVEPT